MILSDSSKIQICFGERINCYLVTTGCCDYCMNGDHPYSQILREATLLTSSTGEKNVSIWQSLGFKLGMGARVQQDFFPT